MGNLWDGTGPVLHPAGEHVAVLDVVRLRHGQQGVGGQRRTRDQTWLCGLLLATEGLQVILHSVSVSLSSHLQVRIVDSNDGHTLTIDRVVEDLPVISRQ